MLRGRTVTRPMSSAARVFASSPQTIFRDVTPVLAGAYARIRTVFVRNLRNFVLLWFRSTDIGVVSRSGTAAEWSHHV
jgi:hypothetical protein